MKRYPGICGELRTITHHGFVHFTWIMMLVLVIGLIVFCSQFPMAIKDSVQYTHDTNKTQMVLS